jgi:hypothetical protein
LQKAVTSQGLEEALAATGVSLSDLTVSVDPPSQETVVLESNNGPMEVSSALSGGAFTVRGPEMGATYPCTMGVPCILHVVTVEWEPEERVMVLESLGSCDDVDAPRANFTGITVNPAPGTQEVDAVYYFIGSAFDGVGEYVVCWTYRPRDNRPYDLDIGTLFVYGPTWHNWESNSSTESDSEVETGVGAMADADFAVTVLLETIWPIEGNDYAEPTLVEPWCTTYATDPNAAILSVTEYLSSEPDIAAADPESVASATDEYLDGNCYLLDE